MVLQTQRTAVLVVLTLVSLQGGCSDRSPGAPSTFLPPGPVGSPQPVPTTGNRRLSGRVYESGSADVPVAGATIEVKGVSETSVVTSWYGSYSLDIPVGAVDLRILKDGYQPHEETISVIDNTTRNFELTLIRPHNNIDIAGTYSLTITAADECRREPGLPDTLRTRTYQAAVAQNGSLLYVRLSGAAFQLSYDGRQGDHFYGRIEPSRLTFLLSHFEYAAEFTPDVVEQVGSFGLLAIGGVASVDLPITQRTGTLAGWLDLLATNPYDWAEPVTLATCYSEHHRFVLSR